MKEKHEKTLRIVIEKLKYFNYSERTIETYSCYCKKFLYSVDKYSQHLIGEDFQNYLNEFKFTSASQQNQIINAIKFMYEKVLNRKYNKIDFQRPRKEKKLPKIIDNDFFPAFRRRGISVLQTRVTERFFLACFCTEITHF